MKVNFKRKFYIKNTSKIFYIINKWYPKGSKMSCQTWSSKFINKWISFASQNCYAKGSGSSLIWYPCLWQIFWGLDLKISAYFNWDDFKIDPFLVFRYSVFISSFSNLWLCYLYIQSEFYWATVVHFAQIDEIF